MNFIESLIAEWLAYNGYFVRRNVKVGRRPEGGWEGELDVVGYNPETRKLIHYECSSDADTIEKRDKTFSRKFALGKKYIPSLFPGIELPKIEQLVLHGAASRKQMKMGGVIVVRLQDFVADVLLELRKKHVSKEAVPEQFPLLRTLQWAGHVTMSKD